MRDDSYLLKTVFTQIKKEIMIVYAFINFEHYAEERLYPLYLQDIPPPMQQQVLRYRKIQDRNNCLFGKLLLRDLLVQCFNQRPSCLEHMAYNAFGKPLLNDMLHFNISHSHEIVMCAISNEGGIGIDLEYKQPIDLRDLEACLRPDEQQQLLAANSLDAIYAFWTQKESVLKAIGTGLMTNLKDIYLRGDKAYIPGEMSGTQDWFLHSLHLHDNYSTTICTDRPIDHLIQVRLDSCYLRQLTETEVGPGVLSLV
jgi:4'-phosphopantetheinyl transferase